MTTEIHRLVESWFRCLAATESDITYSKDLLSFARRCQHGTELPDDLRIWADRDSNLDREPVHDQMTILAPVCIRGDVDDTQRPDHWVLVAAQVYRSISV